MCPLSQDRVRGRGQLSVGTTFPGCVPGAAPGLTSVKPLRLHLCSDAPASQYRGATTQRPGSPGVAQPRPQRTRRRAESPRNSVLQLDGGGGPRTPQPPEGPRANHEGHQHLQNTVSQRRTRTGFEQFFSSKGKISYEAAR